MAGVKWLDLRSTKLGTRGQEGYGFGVFIECYDPFLLSCVEVLPFFSDGSLFNGGCLFIRQMIDLVKVNWTL